MPKRGQYRAWMIWALGTAVVTLSGANAFQYYDLKAERAECEKRMVEERSYFRARLTECQKQATATERELNEFLKLQLSINAAQQKQINSLKK